MKKITIGILAVVISATSANAQMSLSGGSVELRYGEMDLSGSDSILAIDAGVVFEISSNFEAQVSFGYSDLGLGGGFEDSTSFGAHGIYNFANAGRVGVFYEIGDLYGVVDTDAYGLEYQITRGAITGEIQAGRMLLDNGGIDEYSFVKGSVGYDFGAFDLSLHIYGLSVGDGESVVDTRVRATYTTSFNDIGVFAEFGSVKIVNGSRISRWGLGLSIPFGGSSDTFDSPSANLFGFAPL